jgi:hypothetical protein
MRLPTPANDNVKGGTVLLRYPDLKAVKGITFSRSHLARLEEAGVFPKRVRIGANRKKRLLTYFLLFLKGFNGIKVMPRANQTVSRAPHLFPCYRVLHQRRGYGRADRNGLMQCSATSAAGSRVSSSTSCWRSRLPVAWAGKAVPIRRPASHIAPLPTAYLALDRAPELA